MRLPWGKSSTLGLGRPGRRMYFPVFFWLLVALTFFAGGLALYWYAGNEVNRQPAAPLPVALKPQPAVDFGLADLTGRQLRLSDLRGKVVLLNFWATWCPPCKEEMPDLEALHREYGSRKDLVVVAVDVQESQEKVDAFVREYGLTFPVLLDVEGKVSQHRYFVRTLPTSYIIDRAGDVRYTWTGQLSRQAMLSRLETVW